MLLLKPKSELSYSSFAGTFSVSENSKPTYVFAPPVATQFKKLRPRLHRGHERPHFRDAKRCSWNRSLETVVICNEHFNVQRRINEQVLVAFFVSLLLSESYQGTPVGQ